MKLFKYDFLSVGVKRLKGETRPINTEDNPINLIKAIIPDILVKGGDYEGKYVVAKELRLVKFIDGKSTTRIIEKIGRGRFVW